MKCAGEIVFSLKEVEHDTETREKEETVLYEDSGGEMSEYIETSNNQLVHPSIFYTS